MLLRGKLAKGVAAGAFALAAGLGADPAMLVLLGVPLAFGRAAGAGQLAGPQLREDHRHVAARAARGHQPRRQADVGAIHVQPDALDELGHHLLAQAGVGATGAHLRAVETGLDAPGEGDIHVAANVGVRGDHLLGAHGNPPGPTLRWLRSQ